MKHRLIYIEWCDAITNEESWLTMDDAIVWCDNEDWVIKQTGFLIKETKEYILLSMRVNSHQHTENVERVDGIIKIPTTWIKKRIELSKFISS
jgi:hypothetical protein